MKQWYAKLGTEIIPLGEHEDWESAKDHLLFTEATGETFFLLGFNHKFKPDLDADDVILGELTEWGYEYAFLK